MTDADAVLKAEQIFFGYDERVILKNFSLAVGEGNFLGILGPNGSGKSTLLKLLGGVLRPTRGQVLFQGKNISTFARYELAQRMASVPQGSRVDFPFSALEVVMMGRFPHLTDSLFEKQADIEAVRAAMRSTDTLAFAARPFQELSGGEQQRVLVASALAQSPQVLFLDEPTASLDIKYQAQIFEILGACNQEAGQTVIVALHDLNLAAAFCEKLVLINKGSIVASGTPEQVLVPERLEQVYGVDVELLRLPENGRMVFMPKITQGVK